MDSWREHQERSMGLCRHSLPARWLSPASGSMYFCIQCRRENQEDNRVTPVSAGTRFKHSD